MKTKTAGEILRETRKNKIPYVDDSPTFEIPEYPQTLEAEDDVELEWPQPSASIDDALLDAFKTYVLRLMLTALVKPSQVLNAMRRLEALREFPLKKEKQERMLVIAEARIELRRRALDLKEAQIKDRREAREAAAARATAKAAEKAATLAAKAAEKAAKLANKAGHAKSKPSAELQNDSVPVVPETAAKSIEFQDDASLSQKLSPSDESCNTFGFESACHRLVAIGAGQGYR